VNAATRKALDYTTDSELFDEFMSTVATYEGAVARSLDPVEIGTILMNELLVYRQRVIGVNPTDLGTEFLEFWTDAKLRAMP
jgi:hypothetical protein